MGGTTDSTVGTLHLRIRGRVQGVGFRWFVREEARRLGVSGWVTNLEEGDVEVAARGERSAIDRLREAVRVGPSGARVDAIVDLPVDGAALPYPFVVRR